MDLIRTLKDFFLRPSIDLHFHFVDSDTPTIGKIRVTIPTLHLVGIYSGQGGGGASGSTQWPIRPAPGATWALQ